MQTIATYKGRLVTELTRDELIEAYTRVCQNIAKMLEWHRQEQEIVALLASARPVKDCHDD